jgi:hypothetical protein
MLGPYSLIHIYNLQTRDRIVLTESVFIALPDTFVAYFRGSVNWKSLHYVSVLCWY